MGDRAQIMASFGGRQGPDSEQIEQSFGGGGNGGPVLPMTMRTAISTRNPLPARSTSSGAPGGVNTGVSGAVSYLKVLTNFSTATAKNISVRVLGFQYDNSMTPQVNGVQSHCRISLQINGGTITKLTQNGSTDIYVPANGGYVDTDPLPSTVTIPPMATVKLRFYNLILQNQDAGNFSASTSLLASLGEYNSGYAGTSAVPDNTGGSDRTPGNSNTCPPCWLIGDVPYGTLSFLAVDDSKGVGLAETAYTGNDTRTPNPTYTSDAYGNIGYWDRVMSSLGFNGLALCKSSSTAGAVSTGGATGWAANDLSALTNALTGLSFTHLCYGLFQNDLANNRSVTDMQGYYVTIHNKFKTFLIAGGDVVAREMTPNTYEASQGVTNTTYSGTTAVDTVPNSLAVALVATGQTKFVKNGANQSGFVGVFPITAVDTTANTVTYTVASGLTTPTSFGSAFTGYGSADLQTISNAGTESNRIAVNQAVNSKTLIPGQTKILKTLGAVQDTNASGKLVWRKGDAFKYVISDGIHDTAFGYDQVRLLNAGGLS
jgi:hypothetical protein